jgi:hypothetical protein
MKQLTQHIIIVLAVLAFSLNAFAQKFTATVNLNTVTVGQNFRLTYTLHTQGDNFRMPNLKSNFQILSGPNQSHSTQVVNGKVSSSISLSYIVAPLREGKFTIPPAIARVEGKDVKSNAISIEVLKPSAAQQAQKKQQEAAKKRQQQEMAKNLYVKLHLSKNSTYQGDQIIATYKIYTRLNVVHYQVDKWPSFNGFFSQDIDLKNNNQSKSEIINGMQYTTAVLKQLVLSPQHSGKLEIPPLKMKMVVRVQDDRQARSIFDMFNAYKDVEMNITSNKATVNVKPLPTGKPESFNGAVGDFKVSYNLDKTDVKVNEAINYKISFSGNGNIKLIKDPELTLPPDFEVYDPKENTQLQTGLNGMSGKKTYEYLIIPRHSGTFTIPALEFSFFNTATGKYETKRSEEYTVVVRKADGQIEDNGPSVARNVRKKDVALLGKDIRYLKTSKLKLREAGSLFFASPLYWLLLSLPALFFSGLLVVRKRLSEMRSDVVGMNKRKAGKTALKHLGTAKKHLDEGNKKEFYEEVHRSLNSYMAMKLNIPVAELDKETVESKLKVLEVEESISKAFLDILAECEMARYAPAAAMNEAQLYQKATDTINQMEEAIR